MPNFKRSANNYKFIYKYYSILYDEAKNKHFLKGHDDLPLDDK